MAYPIERKLVVAVSSRAMFDLEEANAVFASEGVEAYKRYQSERVNVPLAKGVAYPFVRRLLRLNELYPEEAPVEVVVLSRNSPETGRRFFKSCVHHGLNITRGAFLSGQDTHHFASAFNASLFLSANKEDVLNANQAGLPAGFVMPSKVEDDDSDHELRIAFDFDGVLADDEAEKIYADGQIEAFHAHETTHSQRPHDPGPLKELFLKIGFFQKLEIKRADADRSYRPALRVAIVTARNAPANERLATTLKAWGFDAAELFLMGGIDKTRVLEILKPNIFFDDQLNHLDPASGVVPSVWVPFGIRNQHLYSDQLGA
jgi:5'-nucleotidase